MSANLQTPLVKIKPSVKGVYFVASDPPKPSEKTRTLYYVRDIMPDGDFVLIEDCKDNSSKWWPSKEFLEFNKKVVRLQDDDS